MTPRLSTTTNAFIPAFTRTVLIVLVLSISLHTPTVAESTDLYQPVEQAVGDLDPLSVGLRRLDIGLGAHGQETSLYRRASGPIAGDPNTQPYLRTGPGFRAHLDRMEYMITLSRRTFDRNVPPPNDGQFIEMIPANTIFDLRHPDHTWEGDRSAAAQVPDLGLSHDNRIDGRIDSRIDLRFSGSSIHSHAPIQPIGHAHTSRFHGSSQHEIRIEGQPHKGPVLDRNTPTPKPNNTAPDKNQ